MATLVQVLARADKDEHDRALEDWKALLKAPAAATGGSVHWLVDGGVPSIRRVSPGRLAYGDDWIGLRDNNAYRVTSVQQQPLFPAWLALLFVLGTLLFAWRREGQ